jgi:hypothetical protein
MLSTPALFTSTSRAPNALGHRHGVAPRAGVGHVEVFVDRALWACPRIELVRNGPALLVEQVARDDVCALLDEQARLGGAQPARRTGDQRGLACQPAAHGNPLRAAGSEPATFDLPQC